MHKYYALYVFALSSVQSRDVVVPLRLQYLLL